MTPLRPHMHHLVHCHPMESWGEASCSREAHVLDDLDGYDGPLLAEEMADLIARAHEVDEWH